MRLTAIFVLAGYVSAFAQSPLSPDQLTCEYLINPMGIETSTPRFGWTFKNQGRDVKQSAYEILVAGNSAEIAKENGDVWRSGKITDNASVSVSYAGPALQSFHRYFWRVTVFDQNGKASASKASWFETSMLSPADWKSSWISDGSVTPANDADYFKADPMPLFRKEFHVTKKILSARLYISGLGYYEASLNGKRVGDHVLDPGWTTYRKQVLYSTYDVTSQITTGTNVAGIITGNGWWNPSPMKFFGRWDLRDYQQTGRPCVKAEIHIRYAGGTALIVPTDASWQTLPGAVIHNNVYLGEHYDARLEQNGWNTTAGKKLQMKTAVVVKGPEGALTSQLQPPIRVTEIIKPVAIAEHGRDTFMIDFGQNFAGVARIRVKGPAGKKITLRYGEGLFANGRLNVMTTAMTQIKKGGIKAGPGAPETAWQEDSYTLKGQGIETWSPRFTFHGFRYAEVVGWPGKPVLADIDGLRMNSDLTETGTFSCSNEMFNKLHRVIRNTFLSNVFSVQSDCPGREKMGYGADIVVTAESFLYNYDMAGFYNKSVTDFANEQRPLGGITEIAPFTGIADRGPGDDSGPPGWQLGFAFLQKKLYEFYGDKSSLEKNYPALERQIAFLKSKAADNLYLQDISDHESLEPKPEAFSASLFYYHHVLIASEIAGILGKKDDSLRYHQLGATIKHAIVEHYLIPGTGRFDLATQAAQIMALYYDIGPEKELTFSVLQKELERHDWHLWTGIFSTKMFFDVVRTHDRNDLGYLAASQKDFPGWGYMLAHDATTLWESWEFPETVRSRNHPMFGSIDEWFYRSLLGINALAPGFSKIQIKPQPAGDLTWAKGSFRSVHGEITSDWKIEGQKFILHVVVPFNTSAEIWIPSIKDGGITEQQAPVNNMRYVKGYAVIGVGSGSYIFTSAHPFKN